MLALGMAFVSLLRVQGVQSAEPSPSPSSEMAWADRAVSVFQPGSGWVVLPFLSYSPETQWYGGLNGIRVFDARTLMNASRASNVQWAFGISTSGMAAASAGTEWYFDEGNSRINFDLNAQRFPDRFYGVGGDSPLSAKESFRFDQFPRLRVGYRRRLWNWLEVGPVSDFEWSRVREESPGGLLSRREVPGADGTRNVGLGGVMSWDSRDANFYPHRGGYYELSLLFYPRFLGSESGFGRARFEWRRFLPVLETQAGTQVLAFLGSFQTTWGDVPFSSLPSVGGSRLLRGFYEGRFRDRGAWGLATEYRAPLWWRLGLAAFVAAGNVVPDWLHWDRGGVKFSGGGGIRFQWDKERRLNGRADLAFTREGWAYYLLLGEAF